MQIPVTRVTPVLLAVGRMGEVLRSSEGATSHLTCIEVDSLVAPLALAGMSQEAAAIVLGHAVGDGGGGDDEGDEHFAITAAYDANDAALAQQLAEQHVAGLCEAAQERQW